MIIYTMILVLLWIFLAVLVVAVLVLTYLLGRWSIKDDFTKAVVFIKTGRSISKPIKAILSGKPTKAGASYAYNHNRIFVPSSYAEHYHRNKRILFLNRVGQLIASPFADDKALSSGEKNELIYELVSSKIGADAMKALKGKSMTSVMIIAVCAFIIGIIAVLGWNYINGSMALPSPTTQESSIPPPPPIPIDVGGK